MVIVEFLCNPSTNEWVSTAMFPTPKFKTVKEAFNALKDLDNNEVEKDSNRYRFREEGAEKGQLYSTGDMV